MQKVAFRPAVLALLFTLGAFAVRQVAAATIADLNQAYFGGTYSHKNPDNEDVEASLDVDTVNRSNFTGVFDDGGLEFQIRGTVSRTGKVTFNGSYNVPEEGTRMTIRGSGNLSASGDYFIGTATERGKWEGDNFNDTLSFFLEDASGLASASEKTRQTEKRH